MRPLYSSKIHVSFSRNSFNEFSGLTCVRLDAELASDAVDKAVFPLWVGCRRYASSVMFHFGGVIEPLPTMSRLVSGRKTAEKTHTIAA